MNLCPEGSHSYKERVHKRKQLRKPFMLVSFLSNPTGDSFFFAERKWFMSASFLGTNLLPVSFVVILAGNEAWRTQPSNALCSKNHFFLVSAVLNTSFRFFTVTLKRNQDILHRCRISLEKSTKTLRTNQSVLFETRQFHSFICMRVFPLLSCRPKISSLSRRK